MCSMNAYGCLSRICTVYGIEHLDRVHRRQNVRMLDRVAGSRRRSRVNLTTAASTLVPSWKRTFFLSLNV